MSGAVAAAPTDAPPGRFLTLFTLAVRHGFYNDDGDRCGDVAVAPTAATRASLDRLGAVFRRLGDVAVIALPAARVGALRAWAAGEGGWARWCFTLTPAGGGFGEVTRLPLAAGPVAGKLALDNLATATVGGKVRLGGVAGADAALLRPVMGRRLVVPAPRARGVTVALVDLSGAVVAVPRVARDEAVFDLDGLPAGAYRLAFAGARGTPVPAPRGYRGPLAYVHAPGAPLAIGLVELLLAQPAAGQGDPLSFPLAADGTIAPVHAEIRFAARDTVWRYYVIARRGRLGDELAIDGAGATFTRSAATLPTGEAAALFTANGALPMRRRSPYRFRLHGERYGEDGSRAPVSVSPLPVAPPSPVWPVDTGDPLAGGSEIFVYV